MSHWRARAVMLARYAVYATALVVIVLIQAYVRGHRERATFAGSLLVRNASDETIDTLRVQEPETGMMLATIRPGTEVLQPMRGPIEATVRVECRFVGGRSWVDSVDVDWMAEDFHDTLLVTAGGVRSATRVRRTGFRIAP